MDGSDGLADGAGGVVLSVDACWEVLPAERAAVVHAVKMNMDACNLLPGPACTQLAIFSVWRVAGPLGAVVGGVAFIAPGLAIILALAGLFLASSPPTWVLGAGAGAGAAVAAVAVGAGISLVPASWRRAQVHWRWVGYAAAGGLAAATVGPWLVVVLVGCGFVELGLRGWGHDRMSSFVGPLLIGVLIPVTGGLLALAWVAFKVGASRTRVASSSFPSCRATLSTTFTG